VIPTVREGANDALKPARSYPMVQMVDADMSAPPLV
jgi:hypothetical protein